MEPQSESFRSGAINNKSENPLLRLDAPLEDLLAVFDEEEILSGSVEDVESGETTPKTTGDARREKAVPEETEDVDWEYTEQDWGSVDDLISDLGEEGEELDFLAQEGEKIALLDPKGEDEQWEPGKADENGALPGFARLKFYTQENQDEIDTTANAETVTVKPIFQAGTLSIDDDASLADDLDNPFDLSLPIMPWEEVQDTSLDDMDNWSSHTAVREDNFYHLPTEEQSPNNNIPTAQADARQQLDLSQASTVGTTYPLHGQNAEQDSALVQQESNLLTIQTPLSTKHQTPGLKPQTFFIPIIILIVCVVVTSIAWETYMGASTSPKKIGQTNVGQIVIAPNSHSAVLATATSIAMSAPQTAMGKPPATATSTPHPTASSSTQTASPTQPDSAIAPTQPASAIAPTKPALVVAPTQPPPPTATPHPAIPAIVSYEAESPANTISGGQIVSCPTCSGGARVGYLDMGAYLQFNNIRVQSSKNYTLTLYYTNADQYNGRATFISVNGNGDPGPMVVGIVDTYDNNWTYVQTVTMSVSLHAGTNTIKFSNPYYSSPDIDRIIIG